MDKIENAIRRARRHRSEVVSTPRNPATQQSSINDANRDDRVTGAPESPVVEHRYRGRPLVVERGRLADAGLLDREQRRKQLTNEYRRVMRTVLAPFASTHTEAPRTNIIAVTSTHRGEGCTFLALNLALSLASEPAHSVVLVDGDVEKPHLSQVLEAEDDPGVWELLTDESLDAASCIRPADVPGFAFLPLGKVQDPGAGEIAEGAASTLFERLATADSRRLFVIDAPPQQAQPEAVDWARSAGQVLFVVEEGVTPLAEVERALNRLNDHSAAIHVVLNKVLDPQSV